MFGKNPIRPPVKGDGQTLDLTAIFPTLQGEGPYAGWPAVFVRLGGCNLACHFCDTEFETFAAQSVQEIVSEAKRLAEKSKIGLVVITGGEPLRQPIAPLCELLLAEGFKVQLETNGTLWRELPEKVEIICSPKATEQGYFPIRPDLLPRVTAFKFILSADHSEYSKIPELGQGMYHTPVYVQAMDEYDEHKNAANLAFASNMAQENGYRLSIQLHKILGIE